MSDSIQPNSSISLPAGFRFGEVPSIAPEPGIRAAAAAPADPPLGPLVAFVHEFVGNGFNTIFRPDSVQTPTKLPIDPPPPAAGIDNILELNLTTESLAFSQSLGTVPNRGTSPQGDIKLNGVPYLQTITDVTSGVGIHVEPGLWMAVPKTSTPAEGPTLVRMASIPHGTTITAQGTSKQIVGKPVIPSVNITPFIVGQTQTTGPVVFPSQTAANKSTFRIPQDLTSFIAAGTITQAILTDPNTVLKNHIAHRRLPGQLRYLSLPIPRCHSLAAVPTTLLFWKVTRPQTSRMPKPFKWKRRSGSKRSRKPLPCRSSRLGRLR